MDPLYFCQGLTQILCKLESNSIKVQLFLKKPVSKTFKQEKLILIKKIYAGYVKAGLNADSN